MSLVVNRALGGERPGKRRIEKFGGPVLIITKTLFSYTIPEGKMNRNFVVKK